MSLIAVLEMRMPPTLHVCTHGMLRGPEYARCLPECSCPKRPGNQTHHWVFEAGPKDAYCRYCEKVIPKAFRR